MEQSRRKAELPPIPAKRYFTIGEVSELCGVKPHVLRYWEQEFTQLKPVKRRGNRRYYQHHEVLLIRRIRELLYDQGFTISGARNRLDEPRRRSAPAPDGAIEDGRDLGDLAPQPELAIRAEFEAILRWKKAPEPISPARLSGSRVIEYWYCSVVTQRTRSTGREVHRLFKGKKFKGRQ
jgi:DNA-binding transcriptional MerR regulator